MANNAYYKTSLIGGGTTDLDSIDGTGLVDGDVGLVMDGGRVYFYKLNATSGATESSPDIIAPDANATTKRWILQDVEEDLPHGYGNTIKVAKSGGQYTTIQAGINAANSGDTIMIYDGTYTENVVTKAGGAITMVGHGSMGSVVIESNTGTCLTVPSTPMSMGFFKNLKLKSAATGNNASKLFSGSGLVSTFNNVFFDYDINNGYTEKIIELVAGKYSFTGCKFDFDSTGSHVGESTFLSVAGTVEYNLMQGFSTMTVADVHQDCHLHFITDSSNQTNIVRDLDCTLTASAAAFEGNIDFQHITNSDNPEIIGSKVVLTTPSGANGSIGHYVHVMGTGGGDVHSTSNRISITGFDTNCFSEISSTETVTSHFDDIVADDGVIGTGTYSYVNSPSNGNLQMSGDIISKVLEITADYDASEDWKFGILSVTPSSSDVTVTFNTTEINSLPSGSKRTFVNQCNDHNVIIDTNGINVSGSVNDRAIYPCGYIVMEKIGSDFIITGSKSTSFNIELTDIANKSLHIDFSDESTVTTSGNNITQIVDKINSWPATPSSAGYVDYGTTTQNSLKTGLWDTTNSPLSFGNKFINSNTTGRGMTIIAVVKPRVTNDAIMSKYYDSTPQREWRFNTNSVTIYQSLSATGNEGVVTFSSNYGEWQILEINWLPGSKTTAYKNGFLLGTSAYDIPSIPAGTADLLVGASDATGSDFYGEIGEIICLSDTLSDDERASLTSKLGAKWDIDVVAYSSSAVSPFERDDISSTIRPVVTNDNLDIGSGYFTSKNSYVWAYVSSSAVTDITTAGTYYPIEGTFVNVVEDFSSATVVTPGIKYDGTPTKYFKILIQAQIQADNANTTTTIGIKKNGTLVTGSTINTLCRVATEPYHIGSIVLVELSTSDEIQLVTTSDGSGDEITFGNLQTMIEPIS